MENLLFEEGAKSKYFCDIKNLNKAALLVFIMNSYNVKISLSREMRFFFAEDYRFTDHHPKNLVLK